MPIIDAELVGRFFAVVDADPALRQAVTNGHNRALKLIKARNERGLTVADEIREHFGQVA